MASKNRKKAKGRAHWKRTGNRGLPIGTIRRRLHGSHVMRMIKFGPSHRAWMPLGHWQWRQRHGEVPAGQVLVRLDGDPLNDDPANFAPMTRPEKARHYARLYPERSAIHTEKHARAMRRVNSERGAVNQFYREKRKLRAERGIEV